MNSIYVKVGVVSNIPGAETVLDDAISLAEKLGCMVRLDYNGREVTVHPGCNGEDRSYIRDELLNYMKA